ncbi:hypothetical protein [Nocardia cerradoensis]|uniref:hypothetical protein n=1 Tax=Nocardia cerradoensis TaxID=85688 RepID=UPI000B8B0941|nr:hypothetical protein [Nocardia cerradoensis]
MTLVSMFESHPEPEETEMYGVMNHERVPVMTTGFAHIIMQVHIDCALCVCPVKQQAKQRLIEAKRLVPDSTRQ